MVNWLQGHGFSRLIDAHGQGRLFHLVQNQRKATVEHIAEKVIKERYQESGHTVHPRLLCMVLYVCRCCAVPMQTPVHHQQNLQWAPEHQNWSREPGKRQPGLMNHSLLNHLESVCGFPREEMASGYSMGRRQGSGGIVVF